MTPHGSFLAVYTLWRREMVRLLRQPSRIASAAGSPLLFWLFIGSGFSRSFRMPGAAGEMDYRQYFFPGTVALLVLFLALLALGLTAVGFAFAWRVDSTQGFHGVMNLLLIPMWLLSGALFPAAGARCRGWRR